MAHSGCNEGFRLLEETVCEAGASTAPASAGRTGRGVNPGMHVVTEVVSRPSAAGVPAERVTQLRQLSTGELLALVHQQGSALSSQELLLIHDIAAERWGQEPKPVAADALALSREVMLVAVSKCG